MDPAHAPVLDYVLSLRPRLHGPRDAPADFFEHCKKLLSHDGFLYDLELGLGPNNWVYTAT